MALTLQILLYATKEPIYVVLWNYTCITWKRAHPNDISYVDGFGYEVNAFLCCMLLGVEA